VYFTSPHCWDNQRRSGGGSGRNGGFAFSFWGVADGELGAAGVGRRIGEEHSAPLDEVQALVFVKQVDVWKMKEGLAGLRYRQTNARAHTL